MTTVLGDRRPLERARGASVRERAEDLWTWRPAGIRLPVVAVIGGAVLVVGVLAAFSPVAAAGLIIAVVGAVWLLEKPVRAGLLAVAVVPPLSGLRPGLPVPGYRLTEVLVAGLAGLILLGATTHRAPAWRTIDWAAFTYTMGSMVIATLNLVRRGAAVLPELATIVGPMQFFLLYRIIVGTLTRRRDRERAVSLLVLGSAPVALIAIFQQLNVAGTRAFVDSITASEVFGGWSYENFPRATGPFPSWHTLAGYLVVVMLLGVATYTSPRCHIAKPALVGVLLADAAALVLSQTFTSLIALGIGTILLLWWRKALRNLWWLVLAAMLVLSLFGGALTDRRDSQIEGASSSGVPSTLAYRGEVWQSQYAPIIARHWLTGFGPDLPDVIEWRYTESAYLSLILRGGLPLLVMYGGWQYHVGKLARRRRGSPGTDGSAEMTVLAVTILLVPMNALWPYVVNSGLAQPYWVAIGLMTAALVSRDEEDEADDAAHPRPAATLRRAHRPAPTLTLAADRAALDSG